MTYKQLREIRILDLIPSSVYFCFLKYADNSLNKICDTMDFDSLKINLHYN